MNHTELKIFKICGYEWDKIKLLINKLPLYLDKSKLILLDNFIGELHDDFHLIIPSYKFRDYIIYLLTEKDKSEILSFTKLFKLGTMFPDFNFDNLIEIKDDNIFNNIIDKYSNVFISTKDIPLDPLTNLTLSNDKFNISEYIFKNMLKRFGDYSKNIYMTNQNRLEKIISYLPKSNMNFTSIIYTLNFQMNRRSTLLFEYVKKNIAEKTIIDIENIQNDKKNNFLELYLYVLFKKLIEQDKFEDFEEILNLLYCSSQLNLLEMINLIKPELIKLDLMGLKKIIYYGRFKVFEFLFFNIPYFILDLLSKTNPLDISESDDISYIDDIWDGTIWYERESEKKIIGTRRHKELIKFILEICAEKNYSHVLFTENIKKNWISLALQYKLETNFQDSRYFISYDELLKILELSFDINNKNSIQTHIKMFGKKATWDWIKESGDEKFLDLFFE
jgi:hypothetical protein